MRKPNAKTANKTNNGKKSEISAITQKCNVFNHQIPLNPQILAKFGLMKFNIKQRNGIIDKF